MFESGDNSAIRNLDEALSATYKNSFSADTTVATLDGAVPISDLEVGDTVLAYDESTGATGEYTVTDTFSHTDEVIVLLSIDGELIETTAEHPFYTVEGEWVNAGDLEPGDWIQSYSGDLGTVEAVVFVAVAQPMYNLTVEEAHTFFVGDGQWLVHNICQGVVDNNILDEAAKGNQAAIDFLDANRGTLGAGPQVQAEFTAPNTDRTLSDFENILSQYDIEFQTPHYPAIEGDAINLQNIVANAKGNRALLPGDAMVLAEAEAIGVPVQTADVKFAKRILDLGGNVNFVDLFPGPGGTLGNAAQKFANYANLFASQPGLKIIR